jgi:hypothetical protein
VNGSQGQKTLRNAYCKSFIRFYLTWVTVSLLKSPLRCALHHNKLPFKCLQGTASLREPLAWKEQTISTRMLTVVSCPTLFDSLSLISMHLHPGLHQLTPLVRVILRGNISYPHIPSNAPRLPTMLIKERNNSTPESSLVHRLQAK